MDRSHLVRCSESSLAVAAVHSPNAELVVASGPVACSLPPAWSFAASAADALAACEAGCSGMSTGLWSPAAEPTPTRNIADGMSGSASDTALPSELLVAAAVVTPANAASKASRTALTLMALSTDRLHDEGVRTPDTGAPRGVGRGTPYPPSRARRRSAWLQVRHGVGAGPGPWPRTEDQSRWREMHRGVQPRR